MNTLIVEENQHDTEREVPALANPLQLISSLVVDLQHIESLNTIDGLISAHSRLMHVAIKVNGRVINAMLDTGATHTFVASRIVPMCELAVSNCPSFTKAVNAKAQAVEGMAYKVSSTIGD